MEPPNSTKKSGEPVVAPGKNSQSDLDLPDWSGMDDSSNRVTVEAALQLCEDYPLLIATARPDALKARPEKCTVEFIL